MPKKRSEAVRMRIRVYAGNRMLGPGKMQLLEFVGATGSLAEAAKQMGMSYMRAWSLVQELNRDSKRPMVEMSRGGSVGGTAAVTAFGNKVLALYKQMDGAAMKAAKVYGQKLAKLLE